MVVFWLIFLVNSPMSFTSDLVNQSIDPSTGLHVAINQLISHFNSFCLYMHTTLAIIRMQSFFVSIVIICWPRGREHTRDYWKEIWEGYYKIGFELQPAKVKIFTLISDLQWNQEVTALDSVTNGSMCFACCNYLTFPNVLAVFICINSAHFEFVLLVSGKKKITSQSQRFYQNFYCCIHCD